MIFLSGGTGFLGRHLVPALCRAGFNARVLTRDPARCAWMQRYPGIEIVTGDLLDEKIISQSIKGCQFVIHAGGKFRFWGDEATFVSTNAIGTENVMKAVLKEKVERVIHISTVAVIGQPDPNQIVNETHPAHPMDAYQRSKLHAEQVVQQYFQTRQVPAIILRPGAYYGPLGHYAFNRLFFRDPMRGIIMQISGGRYIIFPAYISDVVQGVMKALERGRIGQVYNICGDWISHREAFDIVCEEAKLWWPRLSIPGWLGITTARVLEIISLFTRREPFWPLNLRSYVYNNWRVSSAKAQVELGFVPTDFRTGARRTIAWYRAGQPEWIPEIEC
jgi:dihydroflavonol-4-reductase